MGCRCRESHRHLETCKFSAKPRKMLMKILEAMGIQRSTMAPWTLTTHLDSNMHILPSSARGIIQLWRRINFKHLTSLECDHIPYNPDRVCKDIAYIFMERILAYQLHRRNFYYDQRNAPWPSHRSTREVENLEPLGELDYQTGKLKINKDIKKILRKQGVWHNFNSRRPNRPS